MILQLFQSEISVFMMHAALPHGIILNPTLTLSDARASLSCCLDMHVWHRRKPQLSCRVLMVTGLSKPTHSLPANVNLIIWALNEG
jgi:hypothetical protein